eukprot:COSAG06_NODE_56434_length_284_cov_2.037838_1_plen_29_part_01
MNEFLDSQIIGFFFFCFIANTCPHRATPQ